MASAKLRALACLLAAALGAAGAARHVARRGAAPRARVRMSAPPSPAAALGAELDLDGWATRWRVARLAADAFSPERLDVSPSEAAWEAVSIDMTIPRSPDRPGLGLLLVEAGEQDGLGLVLLDGVAPGSNAASLAPGSILRGDVLVSARVPGGPVRSLEGLPYDATVGVLSSLDPAAGGAVLRLKRQRVRPALTVRLEFPEADVQAAAAAASGSDGVVAGPREVTLYAGANLRRSMLARGVQLNDPLARRFDAGIGTGDCGGEGCCCTCAVEVLRGGEVLSAQGTQERQMLAGFPRWRLACKAVVDKLPEGGATLDVRVTPRGFENFYGKEECDVNGKPLYRGR